MVEHTALTEPTARAEVTRYCAWPTQASSYLTGCLEILRIREAFFTRRAVVRHRCAARLPRRDHVVGWPADRPRRARGAWPRPERPDQGRRSRSVISKKS